MTNHIPCLPDYGNRFAIMWSVYHEKTRSRWLDRALVTSSVFIGLCAAWWV